MVLLLGAFIHMFNSMAFATSQAANKGTKYASNQAGINKSITNILAQGAGSGASGVVVGFIAAGLPGAFVGAIFGIATGLTTGVALESAGVYNYVKDKLNYAKEYIYKRKEEQ